MAGMKLVESFANPPGYCFVCKNSHHNNDIVFLGQPFLKIGVGLHRADTMYVCEDCVREMASLYGIFADDNPNQISLKEQVVELESKCEGLVEELSQREVEVAALTGGLLERLQGDSYVASVEPPTVTEVVEILDDIIEEKPVKRGRPKKVTNDKDNS